jgi:hypothetical protein
VAQAQTSEFSITLIESSQIWVLSMMFTICFALQEKYVEEVINTHGEDFDGENEPVDGQAVYVSGGRKAHGQ